MEIFSSPLQLLSSEWHWTECIFNTQGTSEKWQEQEKKKVQENII